MNERNLAAEFLSSIGWDYYNTESAARKVAEEAQGKIDFLLKIQKELVDLSRSDTKENLVGIVKRQAVLIENLREENEFLHSKLNEI